MSTFTPSPQHRDFAEDQVQVIRSMTQIRNFDHGHSIKSKLVIVEARRMNQFKNAEGVYDDVH